MGTRRWLGVAAQFSAWQACALALNVIAGFLVVRWLSVEEYARYSIALAVMTAAVTVADSGICSTLNARAAPLAANPAALGAVLAAAGRMARVRGLWVGVAAALACALLLRSGHAPPGFAAMAGGLTAAYVAVTLARMLWHVVARLRCRIAAVLAVETVADCARPILVVSLVYASPVALAALTVPVGLAVAHWLAYRKLASAFAPPAFAIPSDHAAFQATTRQVLPVTLFFAFQGQIAMWIVAALGTTGDVAGLGAIGRFAVVYSVAAPFVANVISPRIAAIVDPAHLRLRVGQVVGGAVLIAGIVTVASAAFATEALALLGPAYTGFAFEFLLIMAVSGVSFVAGAVNAVIVSRAWHTHYWLAIPATLAGQALVAALADVATLRGALLLSGASAAALLAVYGFICAKGVAQSVGSRAGAPASQGRYR